MSDAISGRSKAHSVEHSEDEREHLRMTSLKIGFGTRAHRSQCDFRATNAQEGDNMQDRRCLAKALDRSAVTAP